MIQSEEIKRLQERKDNADKLEAEQTKLLCALREDYKAIEVCQICYSGTTALIS
jgi:hypothetical protein